MSKLIRAELFYIRKSRIFVIGLVLSVFSGWLFKTRIEDTVYFDTNLLIPLVVILGVVLSRTVGKENDDGTIRNKIVAGYSRIQIFFSWVCTGFLTTICIVIVFLLPAFLFSFHTEAIFVSKEILIRILPGFFLLNFSWAILYIVFNLLIASKGLGGVISLSAALAIMLLAYGMETALAEPEFLESVFGMPVKMEPEEVVQLQKGLFDASFGAEVDENGVVTYYKYVVDENVKNPNPAYLSFKPLRICLQTIDSMIPQGQINGYFDYLSEAAYYNASVYQDTAGQDLYSKHPQLPMYPLYSVIFIVIVSCGGLLLFRKLDIK